MRTAQRYLAIAKASLFLFILCIVLFLNLGGSSEDESFHWNTVHYRSPSAATPTESHGQCPGLSASKKPALVVARVSADGDAKWLQRLEKTYHLCVYHGDDDRSSSGSPDAAAAASAALTTPANRGHEAMAYLTFIIDNYDSIPAAGAVFVHGSRFAWHNDSPDYDNVALLASLNISAALEPHGYHNLRCDWSASTCNPAHAPAQGSLETTFKAKLQPWAARAVSDVALVPALVALFGDGVERHVRLDRSQAIRSQCCAQFVVSRNRIRQHAREEYVAIRQWLLDGSNSYAGLPPPNAAPRDDRVAGRILSYVWHILFMAGDDTGAINLKQLNKQACPTAAECYCRLYGRCNLEQCTPGRCQGQYSVPPGYKLPHDWANTHKGLV